MAKGNSEGWRNSPGNQVPENNGARLAMTMEMYSWPAIDTRDASAMRRRFDDYLGLCMEYDQNPSVSGICFALGMTRNEVMRWSNGKRSRVGDILSSESSMELKKILATFEVLWESAMQNNGYRNPVTGIFLGKNNFGYKDESQTVIKHEDGPSGPTRAELEAKYSAALPEEVEVIDSEKVGELPEG